MLTVFVSVFINFVFLGCDRFGDPETVSENVINSELEKDIEQVVSSMNLPSLQIAIIGDGKTVWSQSYGQNANIRQVYMIGSVQKVFDATAIMQLYEKGHIKLDVDINNYLSFPVRHPDYPETPVTIRMLLCHLSGLENLRYQFAWDTECLAYPKYRSTCNKDLLNLSLGDYLRESFSPDGVNYSRDTWVAKPGEEYHYSVAGYALLKHLIAQVSDQSYAEYMRENIFEPLEMELGGFYLDEFENDHARPYTWLEDEFVELPLWEGKGSIMRMTAIDLAKFMLAHMGDGSYGNFQLLRPETVELMRSISTHRNSLFNRDSRLYFADFGHGIRHYSNGWMGLSGSVPGYVCFWRFHPETQSGYALLINANSIIVPSKENLSVITETYTEIQRILQNRLAPAPLLTQKQTVVVLICVLTFLSIALVYRIRRSHKGHNTM
jgi:CubicO group peptidase (beta-lactamase class C family)